MTSDDFLKWWPVVVVVVGFFGGLVVNAIDHRETTKEHGKKITTLFGLFNSHIEKDK